MQLHFKKNLFALFLKITLFALFVISVCFALFATLTNPFSSYSIISDPVKVSFNGEAFSVDSVVPISVYQAKLTSWVSILKQGWHVLTHRLTEGKSVAPAADAGLVIARIHRERFSPEAPFLISGEHFSMLYPRSLGIFYHALLDPRTKLSGDDWYNRQYIYLKTTAYALAVYSKSSHLSTTITPIGRTSMALVNFFAPPSDTLYSLLYALSVMNGSESFYVKYAFGSDQADQLQTKQAAATLLQNYRESLKKHYERYVFDVTDWQTGLVKKDIVLSGTKDSVRRQSSFYDNVMLWKTHQLASKLGIATMSNESLEELRRKIVVAFWSPEMGCFIDDLSTNSFEKNYYSSDWLVAYLTGMLSPQNESDRTILTGCVEYIRKNQLDTPFPLRYQIENRTEQLQPVLRVFLPDYTTSAIWPNWGMEYIKLLAALSETNDNIGYIQEAQQHIKTYENNIKRYNGYPEVYNISGDLLRRGVYTAVRETGWVVSFEEAKAFVEAVSQKFVK